MDEKVQVVFFDIGDTLATAGANAAGELVLHPLPGAVLALRRLQQVELRLGLISNTGTETAETLRRALAGAGLYEFFAAEPQLLIYSSVVHLKKDSPEIFRLACRRAGLEPRRCMFVGENPAERVVAADAGMKVAGGPEDAVQALGA